MERQPGATGRSIIAAYATARFLAQEIAKPIEVQVQVQPKISIIPPETHIRDDINVRGSSTLINARKPGRLHELTVTSQSPDFILHIELDGRGLTETYTDLTTLSPHSELLAAYQGEDDGYYHIHLKQVSWTRSFKAVVYAKPSVTFTRLWRSWEES